jgi:hypothetical protein
MSNAKGGPKGLYRSHPSLILRTSSRRSWRKQRRVSVFETLRFVAVVISAFAHRAGSKKRSITDLLESTESASRPRCSMIDRCNATMAPLPQIARNVPWIRMKLLLFLAALAFNEDLADSLFSRHLPCT